MAQLLSFTANQVKLAKYWYEKIPYTDVLASLAVGQSTPLFNASQWNGSIDEKVARLEDLAVTPNTGVQLEMVADGAFRNGDTGALPSGPLSTHISAVQQLSAVLNNQSTAAVSNIVVNYTVAVQQLSVADKLLRGLSLSNAEQAIANKLGMSNLVDKGTFPVPMQAQIDRTYGNRIIQEEEELLVSAAVGTSLSTVIAKTASAGQNEFLVVRSIAASANAADGISIFLNRDDDEGYVQLLAGNLSLDTPLDVFIPALQKLSIQTVAKTSGALKLRVKLWRVKLSNVLRLRFGLISEKEAVAQGLGKLYDDVWGGLN